MPKPRPTPAQLKELERMVARQPGAHAFAALAEEYLAQRRIPEALEIARAGLAASPRFCRGQSVLARALYLGGRQAEGLAAYERACTEHPKDSALRTEWGGMLVGLGAPAAARVAFEAALAASPLDFEARRALEALPPEGAAETTAPGQPPEDFFRLHTDVEAATVRPRPDGAGGKILRLPKHKRGRRFGSALSDAARMRAQKLRQYGALFLLGVGLLVLLGAGGLWRRVRTRSLEQSLARVQELWHQDGAAPLEQAQEELARARARWPRESRLAAWQARVAATRATRFGAPAEVRELAQRALAEATELGASLEERALAELLLHLPSAQASEIESLAHRNLSPAIRDPSAFLAKGLALAALGDLANAQEALAQATAYDERWTWATIELARVERRAHKIDAARQVASTAQARDPNSSGAQAERIAIDAVSGSPLDSDALKGLLQAAAAAPAALAELQFAVGAHEAARGVPARARQALLAATTLVPSDPEYAWTLGRAELLAGGDAAAALSALEWSAPRAGAPEALLDLAEAQLRTGRAAAAAKTLEGNHSDRAELLRLRASLDQCDFHAVDAICQPVHGRASADMDAEIMLTCAEAAIAQEKPDRAERLLDRVERPDLRGYAEGLRRLQAGSPSDALDLLAGDRAEAARARALLALGHVEAALDALEHGEKQSAEDWQRRVARARVLSSLGASQQALDLLRAAASAHPDATAPLAEIAEALAQAGDAQGAQQVIKTMSPSGGAVPRLLEAQGRIALEAGDAAQALPLFAKVLAAQPGSPGALAGIVEAALATGDKRMAQVAVTKALAASPEGGFQAAYALARRGDVTAALATVRRAAGALRGPSAHSRTHLAALEVASIGLGSARANARSRMEARRLLAKLATDPAAPAVTLYRLGRELEREHTAAKALALYRQALDRDPGLADAALRLGLALAADAKQREEGVTFLRTYLRNVPQGDGVAKANQMLARLGRPLDAGGRH